MKVIIAAVAHRAPDWAEAGFAEYQGRVRDGVSVLCHRVQPSRGGRGQPVSQRLADEARRLRKLLPARILTVALDSRGEPMDTRRLAGQLRGAMLDRVDLAYLIGGADGLDANLIDEADVVWSLGKTTYPHHLVRIMVAEQLYRAWTTLHNLPYHHGH